MVQISKEAREIASSICRKMPRLPRPQNLGGGRIIGGVARPSGAGYLSPEVLEERKKLHRVAASYHEKYPSDPFIAHGTREAASLCQILLDRVLILARLYEHFGALELDNVHIGGHRDTGWGLFVVRRQALLKAIEEINEYIRISLRNCEAILLPTPVVDIVREHFPAYAQMIKGYDQYANELSAEIK